MIYIIAVLFLILLIPNRCAPVLVFISSLCFGYDDDVVVCFIVCVRVWEEVEISESREIIEKVKSRVRVIDFPLYYLDRVYLSCWSIVRSLDYNSLLVSLMEVTISEAQAK